MPLGLHLPELIIILLVVLIFFGPKRLPEVGSALGKTITEFRKSTSHHDDDTRLKDRTDRLGEAPVEPEVRRAAETAGARQDRDVT